MGDFIKVKCGCPAGDLISFLSGFKQLHRQTGKKIKIYHQLNVVTESYRGSGSAFIDEENNQVAFNKKAFDLMKPLLLRQEYVADYNIYAGEEVDFDMDKIRQEIFTNQPLGSLNRWFFYAFPEMANDLSKSWVRANPIVNNKIIINFTNRHRNPWVNYYFLKEYENDIMFTGLLEESHEFNKKWNLNINYLLVEDFNELAQAMAGCKFFMGNQSFCFQLAEALKIPRLLEIFPVLPNVIPVGENAYDAYHQSAIEYYFKKLSK